MLAMLQVKPIMVDRIREAQMEDAYLRRMRGKVEIGTNKQFTIREDGALVIGNRICVPEEGELREQIMIEAHTAPYAMHPGSTKMYQDLKDNYWWKGMKKGIA